MGRYDCNAAGVVYVIAYPRWHKLYAGAPDGRLADSFGQHPRSVDGFN